ncbi:helix-turn-helix domain-containing protein [Natrononativus amylolyticus]|uniref:helix-turn-helix domain-containing protein n=1 Tax=Natrononativus amylolyticus TaxID=2963434 RepID=UPI0020CEB3F7|nr:helix-turn-helix domain-containing protein [Natrononativus amylolyticus]
MKYLSMWLSQPDWMLHPMQRFIREEEAVRYEELQAWNVDTQAPRLEYELFYVEADREPYERALEAADSIRWYDLTPIDADAFYLYVCQETREEDRAWRAGLTALDLVVVPPIVYDERADFSMTVVGTGENLRALLEGLPEEIDVAVEAIGEYDRRHAPVADALTNRQFEALEAGLAVGYFEIPREGGVEAVAAELGCASSTAALLLQKAQARLVRRLIGRYRR